MRVAIVYPPIDTSKGIPLLSQNRQFQYFNAPTYIYPMVPAYAATLLQKNGHDVAWLDGIAEGWSYAQFLERLNHHAPEVILMETKTPVVKQHWKILEEIRSHLPQARLVLVGDHVTWNPGESFANSPVDFILSGGDYDFLALSLVNHLQSGSKLEGGIYWRKNGDGHQVEVANSGPTDFKQHALDDLPIIDRHLTRWELYAYKNGNYRYTPGTYTYAGRDCWWGRCTFCVWEFTLYPKGSYRIHSVERMLDEVGHLIHDHGIREIFDDTGTLPGGAWLKQFCKGMIDRGYHKRVRFGHNMRFGILQKEHYELMGKANFRFILYGLESANQKTLDKLDKGYKIEQVAEELRWAKTNGLEPHLTVMLGYPWETAEDSQRTIEYVHKLFVAGLIDTLQGTIVVPYPGSPLFAECLQKGWLKTQDWDRYDMRESVMAVPMSDEALRSHIQALYKAFISPQYIGRKMISIRSWEDVKYFYSAGQKLLGHLVDFARRQPAG